MSSSTGKKIIRDVFYTTGEVAAEANKLKKSIVNIAKSFQTDFQILGHEAPPRQEKDDISKCDQQLQELYGYFGKFIFERIEKNKLQYKFNSGYEDLQYKADELLGKFKTEPNLRSEPEASRKSLIPKAVEQDLNSEGILKTQSEDPLVRLKTAVELSKLNTPQARMALLGFAKDPDKLIRRVIVNCITPEGGEEETFAIVKFINDPDEDVARIAIRKSAKILNRLGFTYLISKLECENVKLRQEAIDALIEIAGSDLGFNPSASLSDRTQAILRWKKIWEQNQMNTQFLRDLEATRRIVKNHYDHKKTPAVTAIAEEKVAPEEKTVSHETVKRIKKVAK